MAEEKQTKLTGYLDKEFLAEREKLQQAQRSEPLAPATKAAPLIKEAGIMYEVQRNASKISAELTIEKGEEMKNEILEILTALEAGSYYTHDKCRFLRKQVDVEFKDLKKANQGQKDEKTRELFSDPPLHYLTVELQAMREAFAEMHDLQVAKLADRIVSVPPVLKNSEAGTPARSSEREIEKKPQGAEGGELILWDEPREAGVDKIFHTAPKKTWRGDQIIWTIPQSRIGNKKMYIKGEKDGAGNLLHTVSMQVNKYDSYLKMQKEVDLDGPESPLAKGPPSVFEKARAELDHLRANLPPSTLKSEEVSNNVERKLVTVGDIDELIRQFERII